MADEYFDYNFLSFYTLELYFFVKDAPWNSLQNYIVCFSFSTYSEVLEHEK